MEAEYHGPSLWGLSDRLLHCGISVASAEGEITRSWGAPKAQRTDRGGELNAD